MKEENYSLIIFLTIFVTIIIYSIIMIIYLIDSYQHPLMMRRLMYINVCIGLFFGIILRISSPLIRKVLSDPEKKEWEDKRKLYISISYLSAVAIIASSMGWTVIFSGLINK